MRTLLTLGLCLALASLSQGYLFRRKLTERSIIDAIHMISESDIARLQCTLDSTPQCEKEFYVKDLIGDIKELGRFIAKLKRIDWYDMESNPLEKIEDYEWPILHTIGQMFQMLPQTWNETTQTHTTFGHVFDTCLEELLKFSNDLSQFGSFGEARDGAIDEMIKCEATGFQKIENMLTVIDLDDAKKIREEFSVIGEVAAEIRDLNSIVLSIAYLDENQYTDASTWTKALTDDALQSDHIEKAVRDLFSRFGGDDDDDDDKSDETKRSLNVKSTIDRISLARRTMKTSDKRDALKQKIAALIRSLNL